MVLTVTEDESLMEIGRDLAGKDIIENAYIFAAALRCSEGYQNIQPGEYVINSAQRPVRDTCHADAYRRAGGRVMDRERVLDFIRSFSVDRGSDSLKAIEAEAVRDRVPVIRRETRELLKILLQMKKPEKILEVGAAIGFSSVFMGENTSPATKITTIENYPPRIERAKANIAMAGMEERITLLEGRCCPVAQRA